MAKIFYNLYKFKKFIKKLNKKISLTSGCFDIFHYGHAKFLNDASKFSEYFVVALNSDNSIKKIKGSERPIIQLKYRIGLLASLNFIDAIIVFDEKTPLKIVKAIKPYYFIKGGDYDKSNLELKKISMHSKKIKIFTYIKNLSTSNIIKKIKNNE
jgi:D-beta-D-heptose 7-phosphate kinase/D-beta-D-heptose 1-phosphate adenosyltransferase